MNPIWSGERIFLLFFSFSPDSMSLSKNSTLQQLGVVGAAASTVIALLSIKYKDRPLFYEHPEGIPHGPGYPVLGNLVDLIKSMHRVLDFELELYEKLDTQTLYVIRSMTERYILGYFN